jgi:6,7-dimethyl-8-ribityllumazine synthase
MKGHKPAAGTLNINPDWKVGIVAALWHRDILDPMIESARKIFADAGLKPENISIHDAPGSFEVPLIGAALMDKVDALIGLGIVLQGETMHAQNIMQSTTQAIMDLQVAHKKPFAFEILHVHTLDQAKERSVGPHNKGAEAAQAVLQALSTLSRIEEL